MKLNKLFLALSLLFLGIQVGRAQDNIPNRYQNLKIARVKDNQGKTKVVKIDFDVDLNSLSDLKSTEMLFVIPQILGANKEEPMLLPGLMLAGNNKYITTRRKIALGNASRLFMPPAQLYKLKSLKGESVVHYSQEIPYEEWMRDASFGVSEQRLGCASCPNAGATPYVFARVYEDPYKPQYQNLYVKPAVEAVKQRADKQEAHFNYKQGRSELLKDFGDNAAEFKRVDDFIKSFINDKNLRVSDFAIDGYASPEGNFQSNITLSKNRAYSFANYLKTTYKIAPNRMKINWHGEDWDGLRKAVEESSLSNKVQIIEIIDKYDTDLKREAAISALDGGATYAKLLKELYPPLRRNVYSVSYVVKGFSVEEALQVYRTKPGQLSLEELFHVANTYEKGSKSFIEVFETAVALFPNDPIANLNTGSALLESGQSEKAIKHLRKAGDAPEANNNLGIAYSQMGDYKKARGYFERALKQGCKPAEQNIAELDKLEKSL